MGNVREMKDVANLRCVFIIAEVRRNGNGFCEVLGGKYEISVDNFFGNCDAFSF